MDMGNVGLFTENYLCNISRGSRIIKSVKNCFDFSPERKDRKLCIITGIGNNLVTVVAQLLYFRREDMILTGTDLVMIVAQEDFHYG